MVVTLALWFTTAAFSLAASMNPQMGTWKLNEAKSKFAPGATKNHTVTYTAAKGDMTKVTVDGVDKDGKAVHWTWVGRFDGKQYKVKGSAMADSIAYKPVNDRTNELTIMKDGKVAMMVKIVVSKDGKSRVVTTTTTDAKGKEHTDKAYYDKQ
jgi:hypothetical protein